MDASLLQARLLRRMLEWQRDLLGDPDGMEGEAGSGGSSSGNAPIPQSSQVQVLIVPTGKIEQVERGTTAGDIIRQKVRGSFPFCWILCTNEDTLIVLVCLCV